MIYIARPCQFVKDSKCECKYWTTARFAPEVITAIGQAVKLSTKQPVILIGYSGGAQVAGLIATRIHLKKIITIAGVLDHKAWTTYHNDPPLMESLNLATFGDLAQIHYIGAKDDVVPPKLTQQFIKDKNLIVIVPNATHDRGWDAILSELYAE